MTKQKTRKSVLKRFRVTKNGKVLARHAFRRHLSASKSSKRLSNLKKVKEVNGSFAKRIKKYLGKTDKTKNLTHKSTSKMEVSKRVVKGSKNSKSK